MTANLFKLVSKNASLFWSVNKKDLPHLSTEVVVETILNYGDMEDVLALIEIVGMEKTAAIFTEQTSRPRHNYSPKTANFFKHYFERHAQRDTF